MSAQSSQSWESIAEAKRAALFESIPAEWRIPDDVFPPETQLDVTAFPKTSGLFTDKDLEVTSVLMPELLKRIHSQEWTAQEVAKAFCKRAAVAHQLVR